MQLSGQPGQGHLGSIRFPAEHGLAEEGAADGDAVEPADQTTVPVDFDRVGEAAFMQGRVGADHVGGNPGAGLAGAGFRTGPHDVFEGAVEDHLEAGIANALAQAAGHAELGREQHAAGIRAPPEDFLAFREPRENAAAVGALQPFRGQRAANGEQAVRMLERAVGRREGGGFVVRRQPDRQQQGCPLPWFRIHRLSPPVGRGCAP